MNLLILLLLITCLMYSNFIFVRIRSGFLFPNAKINKKEPLSADIILEFLAVSIKSGTSVAKALEEIGRADNELSFFAKVAQKLMHGETWNNAWKAVPKEYDVVKDCLEQSWHRGTSPIIAIETTLAKNREIRKIKTKNKSERLNVKIVVPLGLCFLPGFILIGVIPLVIYLVGGTVG